LAWQWAAAVGSTTTDTTTDTNPTTDTDTNTDGQSNPNLLLPAKMRRNIINALMIIKKILNVGLGGVR
jgi:hypothetical protein